MLSKEQRWWVKARNKAKRHSVVDDARKILLRQLIGDFLKRCGDNVERRSARFRSENAARICRSNGRTESIISRQTKSHELTSLVHADYREGERNDFWYLFRIETPNKVITLVTHVSHANEISREFSSCECNLVIRFNYVRR